MICSRCGKETSQIYVTRVGEEDTRLSLCPDCHRALALNTAGLLPYNEKGGETGGECPVCGTTYRDFRRSGLLGCANCYRAFRRAILPVIRSVQADVRHHGKKQDNGAEEYYDRIRTLVDRIDTLKGKIEEELRNGDFSRTKELSAELKKADEELREINREIADRRD